MKKSLLITRIPFFGKQKSLLVFGACLLMSICMSLAYVYFWYFSNPDSFRNTLLQELEISELAIAGKSRDVSLVSYDRQNKIQDYGENEIRIMKLKAEFKGMGHVPRGEMSTLNREVVELEEQNKSLHDVIFSSQEFELSQEDRDQLFEITQKIEEFLDLRNFYGRMDEKGLQKFEKYHTSLIQKIDLSYEIIVTLLGEEEIDEGGMRTKKIQLKRIENTLSILKKSTDENVLALIAHMNENQKITELHEKLNSIYVELGDAPDIRKKEQYNAIIIQEQIKDRIDELKALIGDFYNGDIQYYDDSLEELNILRENIQNFSGAPIVLEDSELKEQSEIYYAIRRQDEIRKYLGKMGNPVYTFLLCMLSFFPLIILIMILGYVGAHQLRSYHHDKKKLSTIDEENLPDLKI